MDALRFDCHTRICILYMDIESAIRARDEHTLDHDVSQP